ncbi:tyrosine-type recombinase/integrase [Castellaniella caeni]|uniref:tyrosine-type recombinase/integrase n=2 Tax=Castellaniella caeni TaxID=266123 RepID=UPI001E386695|nr:tyrosine-type recombinase/integrase [Castellaniella caeni]
MLQFVADHVSHATPTGPATDLPMAVEAALIAAGAKRASGVLALATVRQRLAVLSEAHEAQGVPNPCRTRAVGLVMERTRRAYAKRGVRPARKEALTREPLEALLATCDASAIGCRDRALLLFAWASGGRRRSEVVAATFENVHRVEGGFLYLLGASKMKPTGTEHADQAKPVVGRAARALEAWLACLAAAGIATGAIFRRVRRGGHIGEALGPEAVRRLVQARAAQAGLTGDFAAHSLRSGFVTEAGRLRLPLAEVMVMTGHASMASVVGYHRTGAALTSRVAHMLDIVPPTELSSVEPREN